MSYAEAGLLLMRQRLIVLFFSLVLPWRLLDCSVSRQTLKQLFNTYETSLNCGCVSFRPSLQSDGVVHMQSHKSDTLLGDSSNPFENVDNKAIENSSPALSSRRSGSEEHNQ